MPDPLLGAGDANMTKQKIPIFTELRVKQGRQTSKQTFNVFIHSADTYYILNKCPLTM